MPDQNIVASMPSLPFNPATEIGSLEKNGVGRAIINITNGENVFIEGNSDFKLSFGHSDKSSGYLQAAVEDLHTKRDEVLESIVNRQETLPPAACESSTLIARSDSNAMDRLFNSISDSGKNVELRERFNHADAAVRLAVTDLAALILEVRESGGGVDKYNSLNQRLCALIQKDKLGDRSGFAASYVGNAYDEVNKLRSDVAKELTPLLGSEKLFDVVVTRDAMQEIRKNVEEKYGPQHLATWEKINDAKGLISSAATEALGRLLEASSKNAEQRDLTFVNLANQRRLALHLPELNRPTEETAKPDPVKKGPAPAPERGPQAGNPAMWPPNFAPVQNANPNINFSPVISIRIPETNGHRTTERSDQESPTSHKTENNNGSDLPQKLNIERGKIDPELGRLQSHLRDVSVLVANGILSDGDTWLTPTQAPRFETPNAVATGVPKTSTESVKTLQDDVDGSDSNTGSGSGSDTTSVRDFAVGDDYWRNTWAEDEPSFDARSEWSFNDRTDPKTISGTSNATPETRQSSEDVVDPHLRNASHQTGTPAGNGSSDPSGSSGPNSPNGPNGPMDSDTQFQQILKKFQGLKGVPKGRPLTGAPDFVWGKVDRLSTSERPVLIDVKAPDPKKFAREPITLRSVISQDEQGIRYQEVQPSQRLSTSENPVLVGPDK